MTTVAVDALANPAGACALLDLEDERVVVLRAVPEPGDDEGEFGPAPRAPVWVPLAAGGGRIEIASAVGPCCDVAGCELQKMTVGAWLVRGDERLLFARVTAADAMEANATVRPVADRVAAKLGAVVDGDGATSGPVSVVPGAAFAPEDLGALVLAPEGGRLVLRDHTSRGPRASARSKYLVALALALAAVPAWVVCGRLVAQGSLLAAPIVGAVALLLSLTAYAFFGVARFASRYVATSAPLVVIAPGRVVVAPWVSRTGAVDLRPEGRFGAAIPLVEVHGASPKRREKGWAIELASDHGPIDVALLPREDVAAFWARALARALAAAAHPAAKPTAKQRARQR